MFMCLNISRHVFICVDACIMLAAVVMPTHCGHVYNSTAIMSSWYNMLNMYVHMSISLCEHYCVQYCVHACCRLHLAEGMMSQDDPRRADNSWM